MKNLKKRTGLLLALLLLLSICACGSKNAAPTQNATSTGESVAADTSAPDDATEQSVPKPTTDRSGASISIPDNTESIVVLAPSIAETLIDLDCAKNIVAVDTQTQAYGYEQLSADLPAFDMMAPDTEQLAALKPDLIFISGVTDIGGTDLYADLKEMGICVINIPSSDSIAGIKEDISFIASCVGASDKGEEIIANLDAELAKISETAKTISDKKTVYFEIAAAPYAYSFGSNTFLNEVIELIGAENILASQEGWLSVEMEGVVAANPDVILTNVNYIENPVEELLSRTGWDGVTAIQNKEVYYIDNQSSSLPNENIIKAVKEMAVAIYPEAYAE